MIFRHSKLRIIDANICSLIVHIFTILSPKCLLATVSKPPAENIVPGSLSNSPVSHLEVLVGENALLPCDITPSIGNDAPILVLFYRADNKTPLFSFDSRGSNLQTGVQWSSPFFSARASMKTLTQQQGLFVKQVTLKDAGLYRCRVDFKASPTRNSRVELKVVEPPRSISVTCSWNEEPMTKDSAEPTVAKDFIGPYPVGAEIILTCHVIGGSPLPQVTWWRDSLLLDNTSEVTSGGVARNALHLPKLRDADLLTALTCKATNSNLTSPLRKAVTIDLAYPPKEVHIAALNAFVDKHKVSLRDQLSIPRAVTCLEEEQCPLECKVDGTRPPPVVTWKSNGRTLESEFQTISSPPGVVLKSDPPRKSSSFYSTLLLTPTAADDGAIISCRAMSPELIDQVIEDSVHLTVLFRPRLKLTVKNRVDLQSVEENEDVEFECTVNSNPPASEVQWTRNGIPLIGDPSSGVHINSSGLILVLRRVSSQLSGQYACAAANNQGSGSSNVLNMLVKFAPKCSSRQRQSVGIGRSESANVTCSVKAHPPAIIFRWAFNTTTELIDIPFDQQVGKNDSSNTIRYSPKSPFDYGQLVCWATNAVGTMKTPCVINVLPIDKPEDIRSCKISTNSSHPKGTVKVFCHPGWDGGLPQTFTLEVRKATHSNARILAGLLHSKVPVFFLNNLTFGEDYLFTITAANPRGTSFPVTLSYRAPEGVLAGLTNKHSNQESSTSLTELMPFIAIFCILIVVMTTCVSIIAFIAKTRAAKVAKGSNCTARNKDTKEGTTATRRQTEPEFERRKVLQENSLPPDRGKLEIIFNEKDVTPKPSDRYCSVHGHQRQENDCAIRRCYYSDVRDNLENQNLLQSLTESSLAFDVESLHRQVCCNVSRDTSYSVDRLSPSVSSDLDNVGNYSEYVLGW